MSVLEKPLKVSVNTRLINKDDRKDTLAHREGWESYELPTGYLAHEVIRRGVAFCVQVADGIRTKANFLASDIACVDIDGGRTIGDALDDPFCKKHLTILYLTKSHTAEKHRFRLVFALPRTITDPLEQKAVNRALALRLAGDASATDAVRINYGSDLAEPSVFDQGITNDVLDELIAQGKSLPQQDTSSKKGNASVRSSKQVAPDLIVRTAAGQSISLKELNQKTSIHCPFHHDEHASAFVSFNDRGSQYLHCAVCQTTWWRDDNALQEYDFDTFDKAIEGYKGDEFRNIQEHDLFGEEITPPKLGKFTTKRPANTVIRDAKEFFTLETLHKGITFIKSPKGSGKTSSLPVVLTPLAKRTMNLEELEELESDGPPRSLDTNFEILLIGHRRALIRDLCARLNLNCYLDDSGFSDQEVWLRRKQYGVCLDSLWKVRRRTYDLIIIDESEQVLAHFLSDTLEHREGVFAVFRELLHTAKHIVALDADLGWTSYRTICHLGRAGHASSTDKTARKPVHIYYNKPKSEPREIFIYRSKDHLLEDFLAQVDAGRRIFLTSNSKAKIEQIAELLKQKQRDIKFLAITSENSNTKELQSFIINIKERILDYQVILTSPSLGTGVDITLDEHEGKIDLVYGLFENLINTHFDIDQQLRRVRHPGEVRVWISPRRFNFETEYEAVKSDLQNHEGGLLAFNWDGSLLDLATRVTATQRASKNRLRDNFINYKSQQGWKTLIVDPNAEMVEAGRKNFEFAKRLQEDYYAERLLGAQPITQGEYLEIEERLEDNDEITEAEMLSFYRASLEGFYRALISRELIKLDTSRRFRTCVRNYEGLILKKTEDPWTGKPSVDLVQERRRLQVLPLRSSAPWLLHRLLSDTPVYEEHRFYANKMYSGTDLKPFIEAVQKYKKEIQNLLALPIPKDLASKPVSFLGKILACAGVEQVKVGQKKQRNQVTYFYSISLESLEQLGAIVKRRQDDHPNRWEFLHRLHALDGALYEKEFHCTSTRDGTGVWYLVPVTKGSAVKLKKTDRIGKRYGFDPYMGRQMKESKNRMLQRFANMRDKRSKNKEKGQVQK